MFGESRDPGGLAEFEQIGLVQVFYLGHDAFVAEGIVTLDRCRTLLQRQGLQ